MLTQTDQVIHGGIHVRDAILKISRKYPTLILCLNEAVQNALDKGATKIRVFVDLKERRYTVQDNGRGAKKTEMDEKVATISHSFKTAKDSGGHGEGLIAPLVWCKQYTFTSRPTGSEQTTYFTWEFDKANLEREVFKVPVRPNRELAFGKPGEKKRNRKVVPWRSQIEIIDFVQSPTFIGDFNAETLEEKLLEAWSGKLLKVRSEVQITIIGKNGKQEAAKTVRGRIFTGQRIPPYEVEIPYAGRIKFDLRLNPSQVTKKGKALVFLTDWHQNFAKEFSWAAQLHWRWMCDEARKALCSGVFQGYILCENLERDQHSSGFETTDALHTLCLEVDEWWKQVGKRAYDSQIEAAADSALQSAAQRALNQFESLLKQSHDLDFAKEAISSFLTGSVGQGHVERPKLMDVFGDAAPVSPPKTDGPTKGKSPERPEPEERTSHTPKINLGGGKLRSITSKGSRGIHIGIVATLPGGKLWELDETSGVLLINKSHYLVSHCGNHGGEQSTTKLILHILIWALRIQKVTQNSSLLRSVFDEMVFFAVYEMTGKMPVDTSDEIIQSPEAMQA